MLENRTISIKKTLEELKNPASENAPLDLSNMPENPFEYDQLKMAIRQFAFKMKEDGSDTIHIALTKRDPRVINPHLYEIIVDNQIQMDVLEYKIVDLLGYVRDQLQNYAVVIKVVLGGDAIQEENKVLSKKEIFELMARKNPNLFSLQKIFNLTIDN